MSFKEFTHKIKLDELTPRELIQTLSKIPEEYQDSYLQLMRVDKEPETMEICMVIDDHEEARAKWRRGDPDYLLFLELNSA